MTDSHRFDLDGIANLARLQLTEEERASLRKDMESIVSYVDMLAELNVDDIEPTAHAVPLVNILREDRAASSLPRETFLANAPETIDDELVKVPQVIDEG